MGNSCVSRHALKTSCRKQSNVGPALASACEGPEEGLATNGISGCRPQALTARGVPAERSSRGERPPGEAPGGNLSALKEHECTDREGPVF